jgi:hypothetical protein
MGFPEELDRLDTEAAREMLFAVTEHSIDDANPNFIGGEISRAAQIAVLSGLLRATYDVAHTTLKENGWSDEKLVAWQAGAATVCIVFSQLADATKEPEL